MRILVTGANGFLGQGIVKELLDKGQEVVAADFKLDHTDERAEGVECDLFDVGDPYEFFGEPDVLLHLAWRDGFVHYSDAHINDLPEHYAFLKSIAEGMKNAHEGKDNGKEPSALSNAKALTGKQNGNAAGENETSYGRIAVMGTMHEIGFFEGAIKEETPCNPVTPYGIAKNALRELTALLCKQNNVTFQWLRGFYIVGNSQYGSSIFSKITAAAMEGKKEFPFTQGLNQFDFIDYDLFAKQVAAAVSQDDINGIINICSGRPEKLADRVERFIKENNYKIKLKYGAFPDRPYDSKAVWGDDFKIRMIMEKAQ